MRRSSERVWYRPACEMPRGGRRKMATGRMLCTAFLACVGVSAAWGQDIACTLSSFSSASPALSSSETMPLQVQKGTTLQVALDKEVRVKKVGQPIHGLLLEPLYALDQQVLPAGSEVWGRITGIDSVSSKKRFLAAMNANFTPPRTIQVEFDEIVLPDGTHLPMKAVVSPGSGRVIQLITTVDHEKKKGAKEATRQKMKEAIQEAKRRWDSAMKQIKMPGKMHRLARFGVGQLPVHPQYIDAGTVYSLELKEPLDFPSQPLTPPTPTSIETLPPPCGLLAHAQLVTALSSASTQKDAPVEAVLSRPLFSGDRLIFPQGSRLKGSVVQVQPARRFGRHGKLRILFRELVPPDGIQREVDANLEGVQAGQDQHVKLDVEGGAQPSSPKTRYLLTGLAVALAVASYEDRDLEDGVTDASGNASQGAAGGAVGFKLIGIGVGAFARSRPLALGMGVYGASRSAYSNFLARGREVVFPKGTAMEIGFWLARECSDSAKPD